jgi:hypothetical protein
MTLKDSSMPPSSKVSARNPNPSPVLYNSLPIFRIHKESGNLHQATELMSIAVAFGKHNQAVKP